MTSHFSASLILALGLTLGACSDDDGTKTCPPCGAGLQCNPQTGNCEAISSCQPTTPNACVESTQYCAGTSCTSCPVGTFNCDGVNDCECTTGCTGTQCTSGACSRSTANSCGSQSMYCNTVGACQACSTGAYNCDGLDDCECANGCNGAQCITVSPDGGTPTSYATDVCPSNGQAVTATTTVSGSTTVQGIGDHCMLTNPYYQAIKIELSATQTVRATITTDAAEHGLSFRSACALDHGCSLNTSYERELDAGSYNLIVATGAPASYSVQIEIL